MVEAFLGSFRVILAEKSDHFEPFLVNLEAPELDIRAIIGQITLLFSATSGLNATNWVKCDRL